MPKNKNVPMSQTDFIDCSGVIFIILELCLTHSLKKVDCMEDRNP